MRWVADEKLKRRVVVQKDTLTYIEEKYLMWYEHVRDLMDKEANGVEPLRKKEVRKPTEIMETRSRWGTKRKVLDEGGSEGKLRQVFFMMI